MSPYLLLIRDSNEQWNGLTPEEQQAVIERFNAWNRKLRADDRLVGAGKLTPDLGATVSKKGDELVVDGPFSETKEAIGGYYVLMAGSLEEASELAKGCPILSFGGRIEVRELAVVLGAEE